MLRTEFSTLNVRNNVGCNRKDAIAGTAETEFVPLPSVDFLEGWGNQIISLRSSTTTQGGHFSTSL